MKTWNVLKGDLSRHFTKGLETKMKTWILKSDLSHSPQAALRMYACGRKNPNLKAGVNNPDVSSATKAQNCFSVGGGLKLRLKTLAKPFDQEPSVSI
ncbi:MAG: hypothetical protein ACD_14C00034G0002 [uncultured bacterium]|nr:MAG: hypothetical protein ACD_14C00034G0002 [uncultured bacterium]OGT08115.1 MAG: hypothetical protein A2V89_05510 [Gammaproteobacteria bacterium RBG_16_37_9]HBC71798.1 hypothetical protein [Coxiellaceae bacterium]HBS52153.1 hypothetical protein [Coxiellaceae bacterium]